MSEDEAYADPDRIRKVANSFETHAYDLRSHLKSFQEKTGEEAITDGFGFLTESDEVTSAYIGFSTDVTEAMKSVYERLDDIGAALRMVTANTEAMDDNVAALFDGAETRDGA